mmetsp:Transcript_39549/g.101101  ORF Transcript_39549/g.101101 Transcript_39549/m.101101 type:complete len:235 (-) Transcript_39549:345-1049(-)
MAVQAVDLGVGVQVAHALDVHNELRALGGLVRPVAEGLRRVAPALVLHKAAVAVVLDVLALDEALHAEEALQRAGDDLVQAGRDEVNLLGRVEQVELVAQHLGVHLQLHVLAVHLLVLLPHVALGNEVLCALPVAQRGVLAQLLHGKALAHGARAKGLVVQLHHHVLIRHPHLLPRVPAPPDGVGEGALVHAARHPHVRVLHQHLVRLAPAALQAAQPPLASNGLCRNCRGRRG